MTRTSLLVSVLALATGLALPLAFPQPASGTHQGTVALTISEVNLDGPAISPVTVTVANNGTEPLTRLKVTFKGPINWTVYPETQSVTGRVGPGDAVDVEFVIRVPEPPKAIRFRTFTATASYRGGDGHGSAVETRVQRTGTPLPDLAAAYNNVGVTDEADPTAGDFDGDGNSFSAQKLEGQGVTPGSTVSALGADFTWPNVPAGTPNNVTANSQTISLPGQGSKLVFLGSGSSNFASGQATVSYTDGTTSTGSFGFPNWSFQAADTHGATLVISMLGRNGQSGPRNPTVAYRVFANSIEIDPNRVVEMVTLPSSVTMHVFDMQIVD